MSPTPSGPPCAEGHGLQCIAPGGAPACFEYEARASVAILPRLHVARVACQRTLDSGHSLPMKRQFLKRLGPIAASLALIIAASATAQDAAAPATKTVAAMPAAAAPAAATPATTKGDAARG